VAAEGVRVSQRSWGGGAGRGGLKLRSSRPRFRASEARAAPAGTGHGVGTRAGRLGGVDTHHLACICAARASRAGPGAGVAARAPRPTSSGPPREIPRLGLFPATISCRHAATELKWCPAKRRGCSWPTARARGGGANDFPVRAREARGAARARARLSKAPPSQKANMSGRGKGGKGLGKGGAKRHRKVLRDNIQVSAQIRRAGLGVGRGGVEAGLRPATSPAPLPRPPRTAC